MCAVHLHRGRHVQDDGDESTSVRVLVVDSDPAHRRAICQFLGRQGYDIEDLPVTTDTVARVGRNDMDLVLLNVRVPDRRTIDLLDLLLEATDRPIILTAFEATDRERVASLDVGADDVMVEPYSLSELDSRIRAVLRRLQAGGRAPVVRANGIHDEGLVIDTGERTVTLNGVEVSLTKREFDLLAYMATRSGSVQTRESLLEHVWGSDPNWLNPATVTEHVRRLRLKIEPDPAHPTFIATVRGLGYRFDRHPTRPEPEGPRRPARGRARDVRSA